MSTVRNGIRMFPVFADSLLSLGTKPSSLLGCSAPFCKPQTWKVSHPKSQSAMVHSSLILIYGLVYHSVLHDMQCENEMPSLGHLGRWVGEIFFLSKLYSE